MLIGLDFDNTIVCYDKAIARLSERFFELPHDLPRTKRALRDFLRQSDREPEWTSFQGVLYGPGMRFAEPFDQAIETMHSLKSMGHSLCIVSHRSLHPYAGQVYDLHTAAREWVEKWLTCNSIIKNKEAYFYETREEKIAAISILACEVFLDDLPEVLGDQGFPRNCQAVLFDPEGLHIKSRYRRISSWGNFLIHCLT